MPTPSASERKPLLATPARRSSSARTTSRSPHNHDSKGRNHHDRPSSIATSSECS
jgi:hypothetical protein